MTLQKITAAVHFSIGLIIFFYICDKQLFTFGFINNFSFGFYEFHILSALTCLLPYLALNVLKILASTSPRYHYYFKGFLISSFTWFTLLILVNLLFYYPEFAKSNLFTIVYTNNQPLILLLIFVLVAMILEMKNI